MKKKQIVIFIVEDNKLFTMALKADIKNSFAKKSVKILSFETGEACMEKFKEEKPHVVILDYFLDSINQDAMDGIKVLNKIKKENPETNVIMLTSNDHLDIAIKAFQNGASDYIVKTETKFQKINYSLFNLFKIMEAHSELNIYKRMLFATSLCIALLIGGIFAVKLFYPLLFQ